MTLVNVVHIDPKNLPESAKRMGGGIHPGQPYKFEKDHSEKVKTRKIFPNSQWDIYVR